MRDRWRRFSPSTSEAKRGYSAPGPQFAVRQPARELTRAEQMVQEAEESRAQMLPVSGNENQGLVPLSFIYSAYVDEEYLVMGSHVDETTVKKIENHEFVDFAKLLPRDRIRGEDDDSQRMELVNCNGMTFWSL